MAPAYPAFGGPRRPLGAARSEPGSVVAGRLSSGPGRSELRDASGTLALEALTGEPAADGDWVTGRLVAGGANGTHRLVDVVVLAPRHAESPDPQLAAKLPALGRRAAIVSAARRFFETRGFLEVETPSRVVCPGLEPHLRAFPSLERWLITSPELHLKRLLAAGAERIVEFARAFRDEERGPWHRSEFLLLEWYRAFESLDALERDCEEFVSDCAAAAGTGALSRCNLRAPFERTTVRDAVLARTGLDLATLGEPAELARAVRGRGQPVGVQDSWDELFFRLWLAEVEPHLGRARPVFVHDFPASQAGLARVHRGPHGLVAQRFELYIDGVEIANAFAELNDPREQRRRHEADREVRRSIGAPPYPLDEAFLAALESGMPPAAGIALGLERLVALLLGFRSLEPIAAF